MHEFSVTETLYSLFQTIDHLPGGLFAHIQRSDLKCWLETHEETHFNEDRSLKLDRCDQITQDGCQCGLWTGLGRVTDQQRTRSMNSKEWFPLSLVCPHVWMMQTLFTCWFIFTLISTLIKVCGWKAVDVMKLKLLKNTFCQVRVETGLHLCKSQTPLVLGR